MNCPVELGFVAENINFQFLLHFIKKKLVLLLDLKVGDELTLWFQIFLQMRVKEKIEKISRDRHENLPDYSDDKFTKDFFRVCV